MKAPRNKTNENADHLWRTIPNKNMKQINK